MTRKERINRVRHDLKRISTAIRMLTDELDALSVDVEETTKNEEAKDGNVKTDI